MVFIVGDDLGQLKTLQCTEEDNTYKMLVGEPINVSPDGRAKQAAVQALAVYDNLLSAACANGSIAAYDFDGLSLKPSGHSSETRFSLAKEDRFVGLGIHNSALFSCTSRGHVRLQKPWTTEDSATNETVTVPTRLTTFHLSPEGTKFAYGGEEVDLSVWDIERSFAGPSKEAEPASGKRKSKTTLFPAEEWRAKNDPNDNLNLRKPVHITALAFRRSGQGRTLVVGTHGGAIKTYDIRAARRPVKTVETPVHGDTSSILTICEGLDEHGLFVGTAGSSLVSIDLRTMRTLYGYKSISGAIRSLAPSDSYLVSASMDRLLRMHSTAEPPENASDGIDGSDRPKVLEKCFGKSQPTVVAWRPGDDMRSGAGRERGRDEVDEVWEEMDVIESDEEGRGKRRRRG